MSTGIKQQDVLQGTPQLVKDAVLGTVDVVEGMHAAITSLGGLLPQRQPHRTGGITGGVYSSIRVSTEVVHAAIHLAVKTANRRLSKRAASPALEPFIAALNGVLGDHLAAQGNPLAIPLSLHLGRQAVRPAQVAEQIDASGGHAVLSIHGLCMGPAQWQRRGHHHGERLAAAMGATPVSLGYNSGLHISQNGEELAHCLEALYQHTQAPLKLTMLCHSMGGLVARSACHYGQQHNHAWVGSLRNLVFLGTPHQGAPLERIGNQVHRLLNSNPYSRPLGLLGAIRSSGITDLRYGYLTHEDWQDKDRFHPTSKDRQQVALPEGINCFAIAAQQSDAAHCVNRHLVGDGLVTCASALGQHKNPERDLNLPEGRCCIVTGTHHMGLLNDGCVYEQMERWLHRHISKTCRN